MSAEEKKKDKPQGREAADMSADREINTDPNGMWTGVPTDDPYEEPIQDADDL